MIARLRLLTSFVTSVLLGLPLVSACSSDGSAGGDGNSGSGAASGNGGGGRGDQQSSGPVELPAGSREYEQVVNLVDGSAAAELEAFLLKATEGGAHGLTGPLNLVLDHYREEYDFVFLVTAHELDNVRVAGTMSPVNQRANPGAGILLELDGGGYKTNGRTKGVIGIPYRKNYYPPFSHEVGHFWAAYLDDSFGFGTGLNEKWESHWGYSSVNGQLGGFDGTTLRCESPAGAVPPDCIPLPSGRTRYLVQAFGPNANGFKSLPFAPLELYLMGLLPRDQVPPSVQVLIEATTVETAETADGDDIVEAAGIRTVTMAEIVERHGEVTLTPESERNYRALFVVLSAEPASEEVLRDVALWSAVFGNRGPKSGPSYGWTSFEEDTGGRATMNTLLGPRRDASDPAPAVRDRASCDLLTQDCARPELACYPYGLGACTIAGSSLGGQACTSHGDCAASLACVPSASQDAAACAALCDPVDLSSPKSCTTLCTGSYIRVTDGSGAVLYGVCDPGI